VDLRGLADDVLELTRPRWEAGPGAGSRHRVLNRVPEGLRAHVEPTAAREVLLNLVVNALQAAPRGGCVELDGHAGPEGAVLTVRDDGPGLAPEVAARAFEAGFSRGKPQGRGLGLAVCRQLAEAWGGRLELESTPGRGAVFTVLLPVPEPEAPAPEPTAGSGREEQPTTSPRRVLVVDDAAEMRELLAEILAADGHAVDLAPDGETALTLHRPGVHDVVLLDLSLPGRSGLAVARAVRERDAEVGLVLVSGWGGEALGEAAAGTLVDLTVSKPLDAERVRELVARGGAAADRRRTRGRTDGGGADGPGKGGSHV
jgi:CheY-like chemotaxis protein/anti-sigma regulatory factor (Ser/Thr protein kinase)